jgi:hypothetical protein
VWFGNGNKGFNITTNNSFNDFDRLFNFNVAGSTTYTLNASVLPFDYLSNSVFNFRVVQESNGARIFLTRSGKTVTMRVTGAESGGIFATGMKFYCGLTDTFEVQNALLVNNIAYTLIPSPTVTPTPTVTPPPASPTPTPTTTPTRTPTPTPTPIAILGPGTLDGSFYFSENAGQKINMTALQQNDRSYFYNNWNGSEINFTATNVVVNGVARANIGHTLDRTGQSFGFSIAGTTPQAFGILNGATVNLTI